MLLSLPLHRSQIAFFPFISHQSLLHLSLQLIRITALCQARRGERETAEREGEREGEGDAVCKQ